MKKYDALNARAESLQLMLDRFDTEAHARFVRENLLWAGRAEEDAERGPRVLHQREVLVEEIRDVRCAFAVMHFVQAFARPLAAGMPQDGGAVMDARTYYVTVRVEGAPAPVYRSPWLTREAAAEMLQRKRAEVAQCGWRHRVEAFYRDGTPVTRELEVTP